MTGDDLPIAVTLTVRQWREIRADMEMGPASREPYRALVDELDEFDLSGDDCPGIGCTCSGGAW